LSTPPLGQALLLETPESTKPPLTGGPVGKGGRPAGRAYLDWIPDQAELLPARVREVLGEGHLACFFVDLRSVLNFDSVLASDKSDTGRPGYNPVMMSLLLMYAYAQRVHSSREIERRCVTDLAFRYLAGGAKPDHDTICAFRKMHLEAFKKLFLETIRLAQAGGLAQLGHICIDGSKVQGNASKHKAMSYGRMDGATAKLKEEIEKLLSEVEAIDAEEKRRFGKKRGDELPESMRDPKERERLLREAKEKLDLEAEKERKLELAEEKRRRIAQIEEAKSALEQAAREKAAAQAQQAAQDEAAKEPATKPAKQAPAKAPEEKAAEKEPLPDEKAQRNFTDPESRILPKRGGEFVQGYNAQIAVEAGSQLIVGQFVTQAANDKNQLSPMIEQVTANTGRRPAQLSADNGYLSQLDVERVEARGVEVFVAAGRQKHGAPPPDPDAPLSPTATCAERMAHKLRTPEGRAAYALRKVTVEPVFGHIKEARGFRRFSLRGLANVAGEFSLVCAVHNLVKLWRLGEQALALAP
jgi:transposase